MSNIKKMEIRMILPFRLSLVALLAATLASCGHVPVSTMVKLRSFDPLTMNPDAVRVAMRAPAWLEPKPGGASIQLKATREGQTKPEVEERFALELAREPDERRAVDEFGAAGARVWAFRLSPQDAQRLRAMQAQWRERVAQKKAGEPGWRLTLGADISGCRRGEGVAGPVISTTFLRTDAETGYLTLLKDVDLRKVATEAGADFDAETPPCGKIEDRAR
jgi:hypothetical protein